MFISLVQLRNRFSEQKSISINLCLQIKYPILSKRYENESSINDIVGVSFKKIKTEKFTLSIDSPNDCCIVSDGSIIEVKNIVQSNESVILIVTKFLKTCDLFLQPIPSNNVEMYLCSKLSNLISVLLNEIKFKAIKIPVENDPELFIVSSVLH